MSYQLVATNAFKRDIKKQWEILLTAEWHTVAHALIHGQGLPEKFCDHALMGNWLGFRECHIKPDMLLIYRFHDNEIKLVRLGSHSELFA